MLGCWFTITITLRFPNLEDAYLSYYDIRATTSRGV